MPPPEACPHRIVSARSARDSSTSSSGSGRCVRVLRRQRSGGRNARLLRRTGSGNAQTLIEHYTSTHVDHRQQSDTPSGNSGALSSVTCAEASDYSAVGMYVHSNFISALLIEQYTAGGWTIVSSTNILVTYLTSVTCISARDCWAVGAYGRRHQDDQWRREDVG